jgi:hypothetical protein
MLGDEIRAGEDGGAAGAVREHDANAYEIRSASAED